MEDRIIHTKVKAAWDMKTADNCKLPSLMPNICERCRDYAYCHRQRTWEDLRKETNERNTMANGNHVAKTKEE